MMPVTLAVDLVRVMDQEMTERHREAAMQRLYEPEVSTDRSRSVSRRWSPVSALMSAIRINGA